MATTVVAHDGHRKRHDVDQWVVPVIFAAWVIVLLCGYLVSYGA